MSIKDVNNTNEERQPLENFGDNSAQSTGHGIHRYSTDSIPKYTPTTMGNQAIDYHQANNQEDVVRFDTQRVSDSSITREGIHRYQGDAIPCMESTVDCNQALDWRDPAAQGHSSLLLFVSGICGGLVPSGNSSMSVLQNLQQGDEFVWDGNCLHNVRKGEKIRLANFYCTIVKKYLLKSIRYADVQMVRVRYTRVGEKSVELDMPLSKYVDGNYTELVQKHPAYRLYPDSGQHKQLYKQYSSERFEASDEVALEIHYLDPGWQKTGENSWHYFSSRDEQCYSNRMFAVLDCENLRELADYAYKILGIARPQVMIPTLLVMHHGPTKALFENAGYTEDFVTIFIGSTGSGKSYLARAFFTYFGGEFINFESTDCAIEIEMAQRIDAICVIDDLKAGRAKPLVDKLERVLRQIGDSVGRKKAANGGAVQEQASIRCGVVITAESDPDALQESGILRTLAVFIEPGELTSSSLLKEYRDDIVLTHKAGKTARLDAYMTAYVDFLEKNYVSLVEAISHKDFTPPPTIRPRQATIYRILAIQAWLVLRFWQWCDLLSEVDAESMLFSQWLPVLQEVLLDNGERGMKADPVILFLRAISEGIASHRLPIANNKEALNESSTNYAGYWEDGKLLKLLPDVAFEFVSRYYAGLGIQFVETPKGLLKKLYEKEGILDVYEQKGHKAKLLKKAKIRDVSVSVLCLRWAVVEQVLSEAETSASSTR